MSVALQTHGFWTSLAKLYAVMSAERRRQLYLVAFLMIVGAFAELATIGAVLPFLALLANGTGSGLVPWLPEMMKALGPQSVHGRLILATTIFVAIAIVAGIVRLQLAWSSQTFVFKLGHEISVQIERRILLQPYSFHISQNSSTLIAALEKVQILVFNVLQPLMLAGTASVIALFIAAGLIYLDPFTASVAAAAFIVIYLAISVLMRRRLARNSAALASAYDARVKIVQESLGGIRDIIIESSQEIFVDTFRRLDRKLSIARANIAFIGAAPRFVIEALGMVLIAVLANLLAADRGGLTEALPILGALALGAQRLLPLLQQMYNGWTLMAGHSSVLTQVADLLSLPLPAPEQRLRQITPLPLQSRIRVEAVSFNYPSRRQTIEDVSLEIPRGSVVGLIGRTGSGKSTLADLIMGLLEPTKGRILVDSTPVTEETRQRWWRSIAHVPQAIFLADETIASNIAFGATADDINMSRVVDAARKAQLDDFVMSLPDAYDTRVGERGIRLSGGQRQRLGIARAIYKQAPVLVLDEATSALDDTTEAAVIEAIMNLGKEGQTIIIIAHRLSTIERCDLVARLDNGRLTGLGSYAEVVRGGRDRAFGN